MQLSGEREEDMENVTGPKIHLKRYSSDRHALCGAFPAAHAFKFLSDLPKVTEEEQRSTCKMCLNVSERDIKDPITQAFKLLSELRTFTFNEEEERTSLDCTRLTALIEKPSLFRQC
jgi:hypothetical protein